MDGAGEKPTRIGPRKVNGIASTSWDSTKERTHDSDENVPDRIDCNRDCVFRWRVYRRSVGSNEGARGSKEHPARSRSVRRRIKLVEGDHVAQRQRLPL